MAQSRWQYWLRFRLPSMMYLLVLLAIAGASYWWVQKDSQTKPAAAKPAADRVDGVVERAEFTQVSVDGRLRYHAVFGQVEHLANQDMRARDITLSSTADNQPEVVVRAQTAVWYSEAQRLEVAGQVQLARAVSRDNPPLNLTTDELTVDMRQGLASSDAAFTATHGQSTITGKRFRYDYQLRDLTMGVVDNAGGRTGGRITARLMNEVKKAQ